MKKLSAFMAVALVGLTSGLSAQNRGAAPAAAPDYSAYILTPPPGPAPRITGASVFGARPGHPFLFTITATGDRPMTFSAAGLPEGLKLDPATGQITGSVEKPGTFTVKVGAKNATKEATRDLKIVIGDQIALTPPMGWNSWNSWAGNVDQDKVMSSVKALVSSGLINHGWTYINIDDTWQGERTGPDHALLANDKFSDMKGMIDQIHALGLKAGVYSTPWITSYANYAGGSAANPEGTGGRGGGQGNHHIGDYHFMAADAKQYAAWGFDYLKYDWDSQKVADIKEMSDALRDSGRDIVYSLSNSLPINEGADLVQLANVWRTTGDINDGWGRQSNVDTYHHGIAEIGFGQDRWAPFVGPGHWIDPDMLVVGFVSVGTPMHSTRASPDEQYTHISMWCLLSAPLLIGADLARLDDFTKSLLSNDEVLDVDQDPLGKMATQVAGPKFTPPTDAGNGGRGGRGAAPAPQSPNLSESVAINQELGQLLGESDPAAKEIIAKYPNFNLLTGDPLSGNNPGGNGLVFAKPLADGSVAVGLFNVGPKTETVSVTWKDLGLTGKHVVRDLWRQKDVATATDQFSAPVDSHGVVLVKISPAP